MFNDRITDLVTYKVKEEKANRLNKNNDNTDITNKEITSNHITILDSL